MTDANLIGYSHEQLLKMKYVFGRLKGELRFCDCGDISTEWEAHLCPLTLPEEETAEPEMDVEELGKIVRRALPSLHQLGPTCHCRSCEAHAALSKLIASR